MQGDGPCTRTDTRQTKLCDPESSCGSVFARKGSVSLGIDYEDSDKPEFYVELSIPSAKKTLSFAYFDAEVCPVCGRKLVR